MSSTMKMLRKIYQQSDKKSVVTELIALRPISPVDTAESHPFQTVFEDTNPPPEPVDQFAPYLSRKLTLKRNERIEKLKAKMQQAKPTFVLTGSNAMAPDDEVSQTQSAIVRPNLERKNDIYNNLTTRALQKHIKMEQCFDKIVSQSSSMPLPRLFETVLQTYFLAEKVLFYHDVSSVKVLYCPSTTTYCSHGQCLVGYCQFARQILNIPCASRHIAYDAKEEYANCPPDAHVLVFPLYDGSTHVKAVIEVVRNSASPAFNDDDEKFVEYLQEKCKIYSRWLFQPILDDSFAADLMHTCRLRQFVESISDKLTKLFSCHDAEIWMYNKTKEQVFEYKPDADEPVQIPANDSGIPGFALRKEIPVSCISCRVHSAYNQKADGNGDYSVLAMPVRDPDSPVIYALVLRGKRVLQFFTDYDEKILSRVTSYVISALVSAEIVEKNHLALEESLRQQKRLRSLLEVAETLAGQLRMDVLIPNIMTRACDLVKADRCSLFLVNDTHDKLQMSFGAGLKTTIEIPINAGIVGWTATKGEILNIKDAYDDPRFNRGTDLATGYRTLTILSVPIFDDKRGIRGVTEMINKLDGVFTEEDEKLIQIFNVFCGISIENARLYRASLDLTMQLHSFRDISASLSQSQTIKKLLEEIIKNTRTVIGAVYADFYISENGQIQFAPFVQDEDIDETSKKEQMKKEGKSEEDALGVKRAIIARLMQGGAEYDAEEKKEEEIRNQKIQKSVNLKESILDNNEKDYEKNMMIVPILSSDRVVLGAVVMRWKKTMKPFTHDDLKLLESYSVFLSLSLERFKLKNIAQLGSLEVETQNVMTNDERTLSILPAKLAMTDEERGALLLRNFEATDWKGIALFKVIFNVFDYFGLLKKYKIPNQVMFSFLYEMRDSYNPVFYHNWTHAVDVTQFMSHALVIANLREFFTQQEILVLLTACICHDANHDGFSNSYNLKAQTPLGILFKNQSVMETHHCSVSISVLTHEESNIFNIFDDDTLAGIWQLFIDLIMATDMAKHFDILDAIKAQMLAGHSWKEDPEFRRLFMCLLIKAADISNCVREFQTADRWCDVLCEEFFKQGDLERAQGMEYSSPMNDREHLDKAKSQIGFYKSVCLPLFELLAEIEPAFQVFVDNCKNNLAQWMQRAEAKEAEEKKRKEEEEEKKKKEAELKAVEEAQKKDMEEMDRQKKQREEAKKKQRY
ncbi:3'5'-cyclic nucleotide phosphodiesterase family protein [Trichomonas vaginalis G3]|uniref:3'5'-cyclic nucleotide phosphodiesterase family protein n=1 Tax=Trichomonas vaginalis (strain ATCC PRA-98 / G3) TaxID=412133 RepID=A2E0E8_TRIV3|nr:cyclic nucleotide phosphodiesterase family [Trichomonas vaginalis G3]EAY13828.1 3'5'-cyclic nucleotide phosphodiesterase family protein [Trichomonas vaginalis G3]KAI5519833.1 cyclic nucleotide phosphodiesterase family [Trichomonas vaginalis G3]|eukprot:XP_001326051.1 3'5'-cyclic nucleotide phosphodiesterase family protein [Trichomonas vaginalis G3]